METIRKKLFTYEDTHNIHKTLGIVCLSNFIYRYTYWFMYGSLGYETSSYLNTLTVSLHMALSSTSLLFKVLSRRIKTKSLIIYKEYQLHTILFTLRSCMWYFIPKYYNQYDIVAPSMLVIHLLVDIVSHFHGTEGMTTVRVDNKTSHIPTIVFRRLFSYYQIVAIACMLSSNESELANTSFNFLIAIQSSTFLMTLVRKNIIRSYTHIIIYGMCLMLSTANMIHQYDKSIFIAAAFVFLLRMRGYNKYILWTGFYFAHPHFRNWFLFHAIA